MVKKLVRMPSHAAKQMVRVCKNSGLILGRFVIFLRFGLTRKHDFYVFYIKKKIYFVKKWSDTEGYLRPLFFVKFFPSNISSLAFQVSSAFEAFVVETLGVQKNHLYRINRAYCSVLDEFRRHNVQ